MVNFSRGDSRGGTSVGGRGTTTVFRAFSGRSLGGGRGDGTDGDDGVRVPWADTGVTDGVTGGGGGRGDVVGENAGGDDNIPGDRMPPKTERVTGVTDAVPGDGGSAGGAGGAADRTCGSGVVGPTSRVDGGPVLGKGPAGGGSSDCRDSPRGTGTPGDGDLGVSTESTPTTLPCPSSRLLPPSPLPTPPTPTCPDSWSSDISTRSVSPPLPVLVPCL